MRKMLAVTIILSGTIFSIFIFNLVMYAFVPSYRSMLSGAVGQKEDIPVVDVSSDFVIEDQIVEMDAFEEVPLAPSVESVATWSTDMDSAATEDAGSQVVERQIIGKEYHEDCGSGAGYWVITYDDGSTSIEQY